MSTQVYCDICGNNHTWRGCSETTFPIPEPPTAAETRITDPLTGGQKGTKPPMRVFETGAVRDDNTYKPDYSGFLSPKAVKRFGVYMQQHQQQADGQLRASDNWKKGMPLATFKESGVRHMIDFWDAVEDGRLDEADDLACAIWFNVQGWLHERAKGGVL